MKKSAHFLSNLIVLFSANVKIAKIYRRLSIALGKLIALELQLIRSSFFFMVFIAISLISGFIIFWALVLFSLGHLLLHLGWSWGMMLLQLLLLQAVILVSLFFLIKQYTKLFTFSHTRALITKVKESHRIVNVKQAPTPSEP